MYIHKNVVFNNFKVILFRNMIYLELVEGGLYFKSNKQTSKKLIQVNILRLSYNIADDFHTFAKFTL